MPAPPHGSGTANPLSLTMNAPHTATANFAAASGSGSPVVTSTQPASGTLAAQSFTFQYAHSAGYQNLSVLNVVLVDDTGDAGGPYAGSVAVGDQTIIQNSQCAVGVTSATGSGNNFTLVLSITFKPSFAGNRIQYLAARDGSGGNTDWQALRGD